MAVLHLGGIGGSISFVLDHAKPVRVWVIPGSCGYLWLKSASEGGDTELLCALPNLEQFSQLAQPRSQ
jgi:hypothetical protein